MADVSNVTIKPQIDASWLEILKEEFEKEYFKKLKLFLMQEKGSGVPIYPPGNLIFNAFNLCPFDQVRVVILGQDPYHGPNQAHGLCFSVTEGVPSPPSLQNIFKEIQSDLGLPIPEHGSLDKWAKQGVLLLNSSLTVRQHQPGSHAGQGWEIFTDAIVRLISEKKENVVFILWGSPAQKKGQVVDDKRHLVLKAPHPSPLSSYRGFFGCRHFSKTNEYLKSHNLPVIDWRI